MREAVYTKPLTVNFSCEAYGRIKSESDLRRISMGQLVREIVDKHFFDSNPPATQEVNQDV